MLRSVVLSARTAILSLLLLGTAPAAALAQGAMADEGTFRVTVDGRNAGTEEFSIRQTGSGTSAEAVATGRVQLTLPTGSLELQTRLRGSGLQADPVAYEVSVGGDSPQRIVGTVGSGRFSARTVSATGERLREYVASSGAVVLDDAVAHHYYFLARRVRSGSVPIIIPRENRQVMATVTDRGEAPVNIGSTTVNLFHLVIQPAGAGERHVWVDALSRVIRVEIPERNYVAVRTEIPR
ncbi:MAG TPA: hypothetical protein VGR27_08275 [Longimicrobiaceae bacterium]|nr:hypothetical protein [Longimicrobiaceae bacterium]